MVKHFLLKGQLNELQLAQLMNENRHSSNIKHQPDYSRLQTVFFQLCANMLGKILSCFNNYKARTKKKWSVVEELDWSAYTCRPLISDFITQNCWTSYEYSCVWMRTNQRIGGCDSSRIMLGCPHTFGYVEHVQYLAGRTCQRSLVDKRCHADSFPN